MVEKEPPKAKEKGVIKFNGQASRTQAGKTGFYLDKHPPNELATHEMSDMHR